MNNQPGKRRDYYRDDEFLAAIGQKIREVREAKNMTLEQLAFECKDIDYTQIGKMERGEVNFGVSYLVLVARALKIQAKDLVPAV